MMEFAISEFEVLQTGADGGHTYIRAEITYKDLARKLVVFFSSKSKESKINPMEVIRVKGDLVDEGIEHSLILMNSEIK